MKLYEFLISIGEPEDTVVIIIHNDRQVYNGYLESLGFSILRNYGKYDIKSINPGKQALYTLTVVLENDPWYDQNR